MKKFAAWLLLLAMCMGTSLGALAEVVPSPTPDEIEVENADEWLFEEDDGENWDWSEEDIEDEFFNELDNDTDTALLDEESMVEETLMSAMEVYSWFMLQPLDVDTSRPDASGQRFQVLDERFNTMQLLRDFVSTYFSDKLVDELFAMNLYTEENGYLYTTEEGRNIDENIGETEFSVTEETENKVVYTVSVNYWGNEPGSASEEEVFTYVRELIDGEWKFTEFPFYW